MKENIKKIIEFFFILVFIIISCVIGLIIKGNKDNKKTAENQNKINTVNNISSESYEVIRVIDGDTIQINYNGKKERVRFIGIDTPENVHPDENKNTENGKKASEYTKSLLTGKQVKLEFDVESRDQYGRLLAYVYLDGEMINKKLLEEGFAQLETVPPNVKYVQEFTKAYKEAKQKERGLWKK